MSEKSWLLVVLAEVEPEVEADWNRWYNAVHVPEILACPGLHRCTRYASRDAEGGRTYVAIYQVDGPQVLETPEFAAARGWGPFVGKVTSRLHIFESLFEAAAPAA